MREKPGQYIDSASPFCRNCTRDDCPTNGDGCKAWEKYFIDNWKRRYVPACVKTEYVDGEKIKADTPYTLKNGEFVEVESDGE